MTPYKSHCERWREGCGAEACSSASRVVFARGTIPCDVLFVGEGPGVSEGVLGVPFVGPAGKLLDRIIKKAIPGYVELNKDGSTGPWIPYLRLAFYNIVGCLPPPDESGKAGEPDAKAIKACRPRLTEFVELAKPRLIVTVGALATKHVPLATTDLELGGKPAFKWASIVHPAAILKASEAQRGMMVQKCVVTLANAIEEL